MQEQTQTQATAGSLDLGPLIRVLMQHEAGDRTGMVLSTSDVRAIVDQINRLSYSVEEYAKLTVWQRQQARRTHMALLENDVALADECARRVADDATLTAVGRK